MQDAVIAVIRNDDELLMRFAQDCSRPKALKYCKCICLKFHTKFCGWGAIDPLQVH